MKQEQMPMSLPFAVGWLRPCVLGSSPGKPATRLRFLEGRCFQYSWGGQGFSYLLMSEWVHAAACFSLLTCLLMNPWSASLVLLTFLGPHLVQGWEMRTVYPTLGHMISEVSLAHVFHVPWHWERQRALYYPLGALSVSGSPNFTLFYGIFSPHPSPSIIIPQMY